MIGLNRGMGSTRRAVGGMKQTVSVAKARITASSLCEAKYVLGELW